MTEKNRKLFSFDQERVAKEQEMVAQKIIDIQIKIMAASYDKAMAYTRVIIIGGYASYFAMWSFTKEYLSDQQVLWSALTMTLSVVTFVLFEVYGMYVRGRQFLSWHKTLISPDVKSDPKKLLARFESFEKDNERLVVKLGRYWIVNVAIAVAAALIAIAILFYGFVVALIGTYAL